MARYHANCLIGMVQAQGAGWAKVAEEGTRSGDADGASGRMLWNVGEKRPGLPALTGIRYLLALFVVVHHFGHPALGTLTPFSATLSATLQVMASNGYVAVNAFFLLSGFVLAYGYLGTNGAVRGGASSFYRARVGRIYPAYLLGCAMGLTAILLWPDVESGPYAMAWAHHPELITASVITLLQGWVPFWDEVINPPAWSLSVEALFYLTFPFVAPRLIRLRGAPILVIGLWLAALAMSGAGVPRPLLHCPEFYAGVFVGRAYVTRTLQLPWWVGPLLLTAIPIALFAATWLPSSLVSAGILDPLIVLLLLTLAAKPRGVLCGPIWGTLGEASYALYIIHWPLWLWWTHALDANPISAASFLVYVLVLTALSVLVYWTVERPARRWMRQRPAAIAPVSLIGAPLPAG
jgi:peptidoglycan/LPS O-acetylase OafA/YrhL